ncbi:MAG: hypothetical protein JXB19_05770 [Bacteroidales bacterium]|nr:hypothetical protein [Bacteroidales bacterium]
MIRYLRHSDIDKKKWDACILQSEHDLLYAHAWYLDVVSPGWDALVMNDYEAVMSLTGNRKFGISYLSQPYFTQQLGVFSSAGYSTEMVDSFLDAIPGRYRLVEMQLNELNRPAHTSFKITSKKNYTLPLSENYDTLYQNFSRNCRRNIRKAESAGLMLRTGLEPDRFVQFIRTHLSPQLKNEGTKICHLLRLIINVTIGTGNGEIPGVYTPDDRLVAAGWFLKGVNRLFFQVCASAPEGKQKKAMYFLVNHMIRENASSDLVFDFTGSVIPGVAYFDASFGASPSLYPVVRCNRLPRIARMLKKYSVKT